jgi:polysaccharide deacetylase 2 family uncharacterized protein YibQ
LAKSKKKPVSRRKRAYRAKRKKGRRVLLGTISFIIIVVLSLMALQFINKKIARDAKNVRISEEELNEDIEKIDGILNKIFSEIGLKKREITGKKNVRRKKGDINWEYKEVFIKTDRTSKIEKFNEKFSNLSKMDYVGIDVDKKNNNLTSSSLYIYDLYTHKINFALEVQKRLPNDIQPKKTTTVKDENLIKPIKTTPKVKTKKAGENKEFAFLEGLKTKPKIAIIVDDIGLNKRYIDDLLKIPVNLNLAVLPNLPHSRYAAEKANKNGWDVLLHLPMEPKYASGYSGTDAGENALLTGLSKNQILELMDENLSSVPYIKGVNNHMGSKFTESSELMNLVLKRVKKEGLFFIDSKTTSRSQGYIQAKKLGIKTAERDIFLDNDKGKEGEKLIRSRINELLKISEKQGFAVGICHPYPQTIKVLSETLPKLNGYVQFISASQVVN